MDSAKSNSACCNQENCAMAALRLVPVGARRKQHRAVEVGSELELSLPWGNEKAQAAIVSVVRKPIEIEKWSAALFDFEPPPTPPPTLPPAP